MNIQIFDTKKELGKHSATDAAEKIRSAIQEKSEANIILATGASQFETLGKLVEEPDIDWSKVTMFHLDEYVDLSETHPASFRKYLRERFEQKVPPLKATYYIDGDSGDPEEECRRLNQIISKIDIDVALVGIGENGHLAFNDPPADFETEKPYIVVELDEACRRQQMGEGWFESIEDVPKQAISMSIKQIMKSKNIICSVPDKRKAEAVRNCMEGEITNLHPASILQAHQHCDVYLDQESASMLTLDYN
ncbi:MAG: glucosamine-6-phosphate deaminase [Bacteroidetes bacterium]|jgi:glucosamine-6-phosphate deaminase|nr:glucosamine-6-phosphate deaminase [Bacteroidota bacterium]